MRVLSGLTACLSGALMACGLCHQGDEQCTVHWLEKQKTWVLVLTLPLTRSVTLSVSLCLMGLIVHICHTI